ncbi:OmpW/AlkL family protein [Massilia endophytica]|uniref:OmpW/AlkL family protein n=1 Tax=Massilia endophytica TaxID=2899220 RepID=UPI001E621EDA|nr:OmpW family outer membrane protein [Massilia endophytica]UGQ46628.1 outer membrane beta-barrel protein [Massilia endophytica]
MMKHAVLAAIALAAAMAGTHASAETTPWQVRVRAVHIDPADKSDPVGGAGAANRIGVSNKTIPEVDISYFVTPQFAAELVLTYPQKHDVLLDGKAVGTFKHLPPTLLAQYHFSPQSAFSPYIGAGVNWTTFSANRFLGGQGSLEHDSFGFAAQAGFDVKLGQNWSLNVDVKKIGLRSDVLLGGARVSRAKVDPVLVGVGVGYRF